MMLVSCPRCAVRLRVSDDKAEKAIRCPKCNSVFRVPQSSAGTASTTIPSSAPAAPGKAPSGSTAKSTGTPIGKPPPPHSAVHSQAVPAARVSQQDDIPKVEQPELPGDETAVGAAKPRKKKKKKRSSVPTFVIWLGLGIFLGLALLAGGGVAIWYFAFRKDPERAVSEFLDIMDSLAEAFEKAQDPSRRSQLANDIDGVTQRLDRWIEKYKDVKFSQELEERLKEKYQARVEALGKRFLNAMIGLAKDPQTLTDPRFLSALQRLADTFNRIPRQNILTKPPSIGPKVTPKPFGPGQSPFSSRPTP